MKTTTILFFVIVFAMNTGIAQPVNLLNKLIANQINGQIESVSTNVVNARFNNRFQYLLIDESNQLLQGPESILLDSVLVFSRYSETESWKIKSKTSYEYEFDNLNRLAKFIPSYCRQM